MKKKYIKLIIGWVINFQWIPFFGRINTLQDPSEYQELEDF